MSESKTTNTIAKTDNEAFEALLTQPNPEVDSLESILQKLPEEDQKEAMRILYGDLPETIAIPEEIQKIADLQDFQVLAHRAHQQQSPIGIASASP